MILRPFKKQNRKRMISGVEHVLIERPDGFQFYLDPAFLAILDHINSDSLESIAHQYKLETDEIEPVLSMLEGAGLIDRGVE